MVLFHPIYLTKKGILTLLLIEERKESDNLEKDPIRLKLPPAPSLPPPLTLKNVTCPMISLVLFFFTWKCSPL